MLSGPRDPKYHFLVETRDVAKKRGADKCQRKEYENRILAGGRRWGGDSELRFPPRGCWAGSEGGGREISLTGS